MNDETAGGASVFSYGGGLFNFTGAATLTNSLSVGDFLSITGDTTFKSNAYLRYNNTYLYGRNVADTAYTTMLGYGNDGNINIANQKLLINPTTGIVYINNAPTYATNALALAGGLVIGNIYKSATGVLSIVY